MCTYCNMYRSKEYMEREERDVLMDIENAANYFQRIGHFPNKVFLCDGDALGAKTENLLSSLSAIR